MKEFVEKLIGRLEELKTFKLNLADAMSELMKKDRLDNYISREETIEIVNQLAEEYNNGWIPCSERLPSKEECGRYGNKEFQVTIPQSDGNKTIAMHFEYVVIKGKEVARWKWCGRISPWEVLAWKSMSTPYQKGE